MSKRKSSKAPGAAEKLAALKAGSFLPVDLTQHETVGEVPGPDFRAALELAIAYQAAEDPDYAVVSITNQQRAQDFYNTYGLARTLDEIVRVGGQL